MASGTVRYQTLLSATNEEVYNGASAKSWPVSQSGSFPSTPYHITSATIQFDVRTAYASNRHMVVTGNGVTLGDVPTGQTGIHTENLSTGANYEGITRIGLDGVERWACQLRQGSYLVIDVQWEDDEPEDSPPEENDGIDKEIDVVTGTVSHGQDTGEALYTDVVVSFEGVDISDEINRYLISMSHTDNEEDETDDLQLKLQDAAGNWTGKWLDASLQATIAYGDITLGGKTKGLKIKAGIRQHMPDGTVRTTKSGVFTLDTIKSSGPPSVVTIKASSLPFAAGVRTEERDKAWEEYNLSAIGSEIAGKAGLGFMYDSPADPFYKRVEQVKETDISFLMRLCHDNRLSLKVSDSRLIIFSQSKYEALAAVTTIRWMDGSYTKYDLSTTEGDVTYAQCEVRYYNPDTHETIIGLANADTFDAEDSNNQTLVITDHKVATVGEAEALAAQLLRLHNKFERECSFTLIGNPLLAAGLNVTLEGFGMWDGKYLIKQCRHEVGTGGYTTKISLRAVYAHQVRATTAAEEKKSGSGTSGSGQTQKQEKKDTYWGLGYNATVFSYPPGGGKNPVAIVTQPAGTAVTILGATSGDYTLVNAGGAQGYVSTAALKKIER